MTSHCQPSVKSQRGVKDIYFKAYTKRALQTVSFIFAARKPRSPAKWIHLSPCPEGREVGRASLTVPTPLRGWRALHKRQATAKTKRWAILLGKSWVVLPNFSAILSKISEMPDMPVVTSSSAARGAGWGCSLTRPEVQQHSLFSNPSKARCLQPSFLYKPSRSCGTGY